MSHMDHHEIVTTHQLPTPASLINHVEECNFNWTNRKAMMIATVILGLIWKCDAHNEELMPPSQV